MAISMLKIRRPLGRLIFNMGIAIPGKTVFLIETAPRSYCTEDFPLTVHCDLVMCYQIIKRMKLSHPNIGSVLMCTICSDIVCNREKNHVVEIGLWVKACYCATNRLMHFLSLYIWGLWMLIQDSRFKHHLFRKYTVIHNGIFIMSM